MKFPKLRLVRRRPEHPPESKEDGAQQGRDSETGRKSRHRDRRRQSADFSFNGGTPDLSSSEVALYDKTSRLTFPSVMVTKAGPKNRLNDKPPQTPAQVASSSNAYSHAASPANTTYTTDTNISMTTTGAVIFEQPLSHNYKYPPPSNEALQRQPESLQHEHDSSTPTGTSTGDDDDSNARGPPLDPTRTTETTAATTTTANPAPINDIQQQQQQQELQEQQQQPQLEQRSAQPLAPPTQSKPPDDMQTGSDKQENKNDARRYDDALDNENSNDSSSSSGTDTDDSDSSSERKSQESNRETSENTTAEPKRRGLFRRRRRDKGGPSRGNSSSTKSRFSRRLVMDKATSFRRILRERIARTLTSGGGSSVTELDDIPDSMDNDWGNDLVSATTAEANQAIELFASKSIAPSDIVDAVAANKDDIQQTTTRAVELQPTAQTENLIKESDNVPRMPSEMPEGHHCNDGMISFVVPDKWIATKSMDSFCLSSGRSLGFVRAVNSNCAADALLETDRMQVLSKVIALSSPVLRHDGCATVNYSCHFGAGTGVAKFSSEVPNGACVFGLCGPITEQDMINKALEQLTRTTQILSLPSDKMGCACSDDNQNDGRGNGDAQSETASPTGMDAADDGQQGTASISGGVCVVQ